MVSAFSIGTSKRGDLSANPGARTVPGPGAYNADKKQKIVPPSWKIGSEQRQGMVMNKTVGPGSYNIKQKIGNEGAKYSIAQKNWSKSNAFAPGPGAYNPNNRYDSKKENSQKYSMGSKTAYGGIFQVRNNPGPGSYEKKSTVMNRPSSKFGTGKRQPLSQSEKVPGPGSYIQERPSTALTKYQDSRYRDGPRFGFGTEVRDSFGGTKKTPGPGSYNLKNSIVTDKGVTMISRRNHDGVNRVPGPGAYNPNKKQKVVPPSYKIGTSQRDELSRSQLVPGPGSYSSTLYTRPKSPQYKIGTDVRRPLSGKQSTPGVGTYNFKTRPVGPQYSIKGNVAQDPIEREQRKNPGPGAYKPSVNSTKQRPQSAKIGTSHRPDLRNSGWVPGPGMYNLKNKPEGPRWAIGTSDRTKFSDNKTPGVGSYNIKPMFADVPHYLMPHTTRNS